MQYGPTDIQGLTGAGSADVVASTGPMTYDEWIKQPEQAHFGYSPGGSTKAYQDYLLQYSTNPANYNASNASDYNGFDVTGYSQAGWDLEKTRELLAEQREYNSAEAEKTRNWQERMSNTAYQRATQDLEAAGLNKWLAVTGGNGASASTPAGATASSQAGDVSTPDPKLYKAIIQAFTSVLNSAMKII